MRLRRAHELLDDDLGTRAEIRQSLDELWWINQHLGGASTWPRLLERFLARARGVTALSLLDVGAGTGQMVEANAAWLRARGIAVECCALDRRASHLGASGARVAADAFHLPLADASVDLVTCNLFLHHFHDAPGDPAASRLLAEMARVARRVVLVNDLERSWWPYLAIQILGLRFSRITRHDGPRSVRQAYTRGELEALAQGPGVRREGAGRCEALRLWPYRLGLILWKGDV